MAGEKIYEKIREASAEGRSSCSTRPTLCQRRHPHRPSGTTDPQGRRREVAQHGGLRRSLRSAGTATVCRSRCRSRRPTARTFPWKRPELAARTRPSRSSGRKRLPAPGRLGDWEHAYTTMRTRSEADEIRTSASCSRKATSIAAETGELVASIAARRWPRPRSST